MAHSEILLLKPVDGLGGEGDQVKVRAGYARNYLLLRGIAVPVTTANRKQIESLKRRRGEREATELNGAQELARKLEKTALAFAVKTGEGGKMFGAVTGADIHDKLVAAGFTIDKRKIQLFSPVKTLGRHEVKIKLHADVSVDIPFDVVSENPIIETPAPAPAPERSYGDRRPDRYSEPRRYGERSQSDRKTDTRK
jgi:large subunit ribosomal protein L9